MAEKKINSIVVQSLGTRGDAQPMAAASLRLQEEGYDVTMLTNADSVAFVESLGVKARPVFFDMEVEMSIGKIAEAQLTGDFGVFMDGLADANKRHCAAMTKAWYEAVTDIKPDLCISGTLCDLLGMVMVRHFNIPTITVGLQPLPSNPPKMILGLPNLPCCGLNKCIMNYLMNKMAQGELDTFGVELKKQYGIDSTKLFTKQEFIDSRINPPTVRPLLLGCDPLIAHVLYGGPAQVPKTVKLLGFLSVDTEKQVDIAKEGNLVTRQKSNQFGAQGELDAIEAFCADDAPPLYLGFGSMIAKSPEYMVVMLCQAVKLAGARAIICKGWAKLSQELLEKATKDAALVEYAKTKIMFVGNTPHAWLFPQCSGIVHHGGAGTTCTASRAGVPQIIIPVWVDQWDMAHFLNVHGAGFGFGKQLTKVTAPEVGEAIKKVLADEKMKAKARQWGEVALAQPGKNGFVVEVRAWLDEQVMTGNVAKHSEAALKAIKQ